MSSVRMDVARLTDLVEDCRTSTGQAREHAMNALLAYMYPHVLGIAITLVRRLLWSDPSPYHTGEDFANEALMRFRDRFDQIDNIETIHNWFFKVIKNSVIDKVRKARARPTENLVEGFLDNAPIGSTYPRDTTAALVELADVRTDLLRAMQQLSQAHREVLAAVYLMEKSVPEAAELLELPLGTAKSRLYYALRALRATLNDMTEQHALVA